MSTTSTEKIQESKQELVATLKEHHYDTKNEQVIQAIENLSKLWKESGSDISQAPAKSDLVYGDWKILSAPTFPDRIINEDEPDKFQYTLGRMSFNMFEPRKLVVTILHPGIQNPVHKIEEEDNKATYNVLNKIILHTDGGDMPAELFMEGYCTPKTDERLTVGFTAGTLRKTTEVEKDEKLLKLWNETFDGVYVKSEAQRGYFETGMRYLMSFMMKMTWPSDESMRYEMKRVVHGFLDILYLDNDLRITRGTRGTVVIVERETK